MTNETVWMDSKIFSKTLQVNASTSQVWQVLTKIEWMISDDLQIDIFTELYSPESFGRFSLHILFHLTLLILLWFEVLILNEGVSVYGGIAFFVVLALFFRWLAKRKPKAVSAAEARQ